MIEIKEISPPQKLSGRSSLLVTFDYNENIVNTVKTFSPAVFNKKNLTWEISIIYLSKLLDALTFYDNIKLSLLKDNEITEISAHESITEIEISKFNFTPFKHQVEAINYGLNKNKWLLLDGCGLGKTLEIIGLAETLKRRGLVEHCLIICGVNGLKLNWEKEINKYSTESCRVLGKRITRTGSIRYASINERAEELKNEISEFFIITNIETLRDSKIIDAISKSKNKFDLVAVDEIHRAGNASSIQGHNLLKINSPYKIGATGTLITNSALSAFGPLKFTENDQSTLTNYKSLYCNFGGFNNSQVVGFKNLDLLRDELENCSLRRTLDQVKADIPDLQIVFETIEMEDDHQKFYEAIKQGVREEADKINLNSSNILALTSRLRQATVCPSILTTNNITASKLERCQEIVSEIVSQGEKVVVFSVFKPSLYTLAEMLKEYKPSINTGDIPDSVISKNVDNFQNDPNEKVFLASTAKMGTGFTLNSSMYLIFLDMPWTWSEFDQCFSRVYRVTNTRPAYIRVLGCANTIDERVWEIVNNKKDTSDYLVDGIPSAAMMNDLKSIIYDL